MQWLDPVNLVYAPRDREWATREEGDLEALRAKARTVSDPAALAELAGEARIRWRRMVERSVGFQRPGAPERRWETRLLWVSDEMWDLLEAEHRAELEAVSQ